MLFVVSDGPAQYLDPWFNRGLKSVKNLAGVSDPAHSKKNDGERAKEIIDMVVPTRLDCSQPSQPATEGRVGRSQGFAGPTTGRCVFQEMVWKSPR
jgi:hypothetical protein